MTFDVAPDLFHLRQSISPVGYRESIPITIIKKVRIDEVEPPHSLIDIHQPLFHLRLLHLPPHTLVGPEIVEMPDAHLVCHRCSMLPVAIDTPTLPYLPRMQIMDARGIVVAVRFGGIIVGESAMDVGTYHVESMDVPCEARFESLLPGHRLERRQWIPPDMRLVNLIHLKEDGIR